MVELLAKMILSFGLLKPPVQLAAFVYMGKIIQSPQKAGTYIKKLLVKGTTEGKKTNKGTYRGSF